ncbi:MAG: SCO family protein [Flavobacteriales bacterium]|nr:SCO family protein [Flavobacteriales bacterium]
MDTTKRGKLYLALLLIVPVLLFFWWHNAKQKFTACDVQGSFYALKSEVSEEMLNSSKNNFFVRNDSVFEAWTLRDFHLKDQTGREVSLADFKDKIIVANFFYASCPKICPKMNSNLKLVVDQFAEHPDVVFLSHTVDPENDSVSVLADYAKAYGYPTSKWYFLTGDKDEIYDLGLNHYHAATPEGDGKTDFFHSTMVFTVDPKGRMREYFETYENPHFVNELKASIKNLIAEYHFPENYKKDEKR